MIELLPPGQLFSWSKIQERRMRKSVWFGVFGALLVGSTVRPAAAATCPGDCSGSLMVRISDLITCVSIALQTQSVSACSACDVNMDGMVTVAELIAAVDATLYGCPGAPTPTRGAATATPGGATPIPTSVEPSATPSATPIVTPTAAASVSMWTVGNYQIASTNCVASFNSGAVKGLQNLGADVTVRESGGSVDVDFGGGKAFNGTVDPDGTVHVQTSSSGTIVQGCNYQLDTTAIVNLNKSPTIAMYDESVTLSGSCPGVADCSLEITAPWTRH